MPPVKKPLMATLLVTVCLLLVLLAACITGQGGPGGDPPVSDHYDGEFFFNSSSLAATGEPAPAKRGISGWMMRWIFRTDMPEWPEEVEVSAPSKPVARIGEGSIRITAVGHATFLVQMDGLNILTDPIWSNRASPVSWVGPKRHQRPGIDFEDLPPIDVVLLSHNHYDHLDTPTLRRLAERGAARALVPLGNHRLVRGTGISEVHELDWWQSVTVAPLVRVTLVPARHFSARTLWDRNRTLWGGFVISGPSGNIFFAGDTGYGVHFQEIRQRFGQITAALLPIAPFRPPQQSDGARPTFFPLHMGPQEAVKAHMDLGARVSIAAHFQIFQLGWDGFDDAVHGLTASRIASRISPEDFVALSPGQSRELPVPAATRQAVMPKADRRAGHHVPLRLGLQKSVAPEASLLVP